MATLANFFNAQKQMLALRRELKLLRQENATLRTQNERMRAGMRRCVTCDYRLDVKLREGDAPILAKSTNGNVTS